MTCTNTIFPSKRETIPNWIHIFHIILFQCLPWRISGCGDTPTFEVKLWFQECSKPSHKASQFQTTPILNCCFCYSRFILKLDVLVFLEWLVEENRKNLQWLWYGHDFSSFSMMMRMRMIDVCLCIWSSPLGGVWASLTSTKAEQGAAYWKDFAHLDFLSVTPCDYLDLSSWRLYSTFKMHS